LILNVGQTADQDGELRVSVLLGDEQTGLLHVAEFEIEPFPRVSQALSRVFHAMILSLDVTNGRRRQG